MSTLKYMKNLVKDKNIASITPTSKSCVREVCKPIQFEQRKVIVEYGPATGVFTEYLLERMTEDSLIIAVELNEAFVQHLHEHVHDPRLKVHHDSAENIQAIMEQYSGEEVDYVLSGIPFSFLNPSLRNDIIAKTAQILKNEGQFLIYQTFFQKDAYVKDHLLDHFSSVQDNYFLRNIPPMRLYKAK